MHVNKIWIILKQKFAIDVKYEFLKCILRQNDKYRKQSKNIIINCKFRVFLYLMKIYHLARTFFKNTHRRNKKHNEWFYPEVHCLSFCWFAVW